MNYNYNQIISFLNSRGWEESAESNLFNLYLPPTSLGLPSNYHLEIPKQPNDVGFNNYIQSILSLIVDIYDDFFTLDDLNSIFKEQSSILGFRIIDEDTQNGSIKFERFSNSIDSFRKIFSQVTTFVSTNKPIFGNAEFEAESFLHRCRTLQTQKGSFITKFEITSDPILTVFKTIKTEDINYKLFEVLEFIKFEVFGNHQIKTIDKAYVETNTGYINIELFNAIKELYSRAKINNAEYTLNSFNTSKVIDTNGVLRNINYFNTYIQNIKEVLLELVPLEVIGTIKKLTSNSPLSSAKNEIVVEATIANKLEFIKVILDSEKYIQAIEAHRNELRVKIIGYARETKTQYSIKKLESFEILG